jgi:hypothetical protein
MFKWERMNTDLLCRYLFAMDWFFLLSFAVVVTAAGLLVIIEDLFFIRDTSQSPTSRPTGN